MKRKIIPYLLFCLWSGPLWAQSSSSGTQRSEPKVHTDISDSNITQTSDTQAPNTRASEGEVSQDFLSLQILPANSVRIEQYLGVFAQFNYSLSSHDKGKDPYGLGGSLGLSYMAVFGNGKGIPYVGLEVKASANYMIVRRAAIELERDYAVDPLLGLMLRIHLYSPVYLGVGVNLGLNFWDKENQRAFLGPAVSVGYFKSYDNFALDVAVNWTYLVGRSDFANLYRTTESETLRSVQMTSFTIGFYGFLG